MAHANPDPPGTPWDPLAPMGHHGPPWATHGPPISKATAGAYERLSMSRTSAHPRWPKVAHGPPISKATAGASESLSTSRTTAHPRWPKLAHGGPLKPDPPGTPWDPLVPMGHHGPPWATHGPPLEGSCGCVRTLIDERNNCSPKVAKGGPWWPIEARPPWDPLGPSGTDGPPWATMGHHGPPLEGHRGCVRTLIDERNNCSPKVAKGGPWWPIEARPSWDPLGPSGTDGPPWATTGHHGPPLKGHRVRTSAYRGAAATAHPRWPLVAHGGPF